MDNYVVVNVLVSLLTLISFYSYDKFDLNTLVFLIVNLTSSISSKTWTVYSDNSVVVSIVGRHSGPPGRASVGHGGTLPSVTGWRGDLDDGTILHYLVCPVEPSRFTGYRKEPALRVQ